MRGLSNYEIFETDLDNGERSFPINGRFFALPGHQPTVVVGAVNWETEGECFEKIIKFLRRTSDLRPGTDLERLSNKAIDRLHSAYVQAELLNSERQEIVALHDRLEALLPKLEVGSLYAHKIAEELVSTPAVAERVGELVEQQKDAKLAALETRLKDEISGKMAAEIKEADERRCAIEGVVRELQRKERETAVTLDELTKIRDERLAETRSWINSLLDQVKAGGQGLSTLAAAAREVGLELPAAASKPVETLADDAPWTLPIAKDCVHLTLEDLPAALEEFSKRCGVPVHSIASIDCILRSGTLAVLTGPDADYLLDVYAACVSGGGIHRMVLDPTILGADDLWRHPATERETSFACAWHKAAQDQDHAVIACLDNVDAASLVRWLPSFIAVLERSRPANLLVAAIDRTAHLKPPSTESAPGFGVVLTAGPYADAATSILYSGGSIVAPRRVLKAPFLSELTVDERVKLVAIADTMSEIGSEEARRFSALASAVKPWLSSHPKLLELPRELLGRPGRRSVDVKVEDA